MGKKLGYLSGAPRVSTRPDAETSGPRSHVLGVIKGFENNGWSVNQFIVGDKVPPGWTKKESEKQINKNLLKRFAADTVRLIFRYANAFRAKREMKDVPDLVYERFAAMQALGKPFQKKGIKWILETNAPLFYEAKKERKSTALANMVHHMEIKAYRECDYLVCISEKLKEIIMKEGNINSDKIIVLPNGVDTSFFDPSKVEAKRVFNDFVVGFVGTLRPWQRLDLLMEAVAELRAENIPISVVVVGGGDRRRSWMQIANALNVSDFIHFTGRIHRSEVRSYIKGFDIGYSAPEAMDVGMYLSPLKLYEYMSMSIPAFAASSEDAANLIDHLHDGFIVSDINKEIIKKGLTIAFNAKVENKLSSMGEKARHKVVLNHSWEARIRQLLMLIDKN